MSVLTQSLIWAVFVAFGLPLAVIDARTHRLPNRLLLAAVPSAVAAVAVHAAVTQQWEVLGRAVIGAAIACLGLLVLAAISRGALGMGDVKLGLFLGVVLGWLGWWAVLWGLLLGFMLAGVYAVGLLMLGRATRHSAIPLGPFLLGAVPLLPILAWALAP